MIEITPEAAAIAKHIDEKADVARRYAQNRPHEAEVHTQVAHVLDALADEIRTGVAL